MNIIKYYKAEILLAVTEFNHESQDWSGDWNDHGVINTITAVNLEQLKLRLITQVGLQNFEVFQDGDQYIVLQTCTENSDGDLEDYQILITEVTETSINLDQVNNLLKGLKWAI